MRKFLLVTSAIAATGFVMVSGTAAQAQLYIAASPVGMHASQSQGDVIGSTTADSRVTEEMIAPYLPKVSGQRQLAMSDVLGDKAPHPLFIDISEQRAEIVPQQAVLPAPDLKQMNQTLYFEFDKSGLTPESRAKADAMISTMRDWNLKNVEVSGYADRSGSTDYNVDLSRRRAETVATALKMEGLNPRVMDTQWYGETNSAVATADGQRLEANRRVVIQAVE